MQTFKYTRTTPALFIASFTLLSSPAFSATERDLDSHVHGSSKLNIVQDDNTYFIEFESPLMNIVGFEHQPSTTEQSDSLKKALAQLEDPSSLFVFNSGSACVVGDVEVKSTIDTAVKEHEEHEHEEHEEHAKDEHEHEEHEHEEHEEHAKDEHEHEEHEHEEHAKGEEHEEHDHDHEGGNHSEVVAAYSFTCEDISKVESVNVGLFDVWSGIEDIDVQLAGPGGQGLAELNKAASTVNLKQVR